MTTQIGPWPVGIDNVSGAGRLRRDQEGRQIALADAANVDIDRDGRPSRRAGHSLVAAAAGLHSMWAGKAGCFAVQGAEIVQIPGMASVGELASADQCTYAEVNGAVLVGNRTSLMLLAGGQAKPLGTPDAPPATVRASAMGGMAAGRYGVAVAFINDQGVGGLSALRFVDVAEGGGIELVDLPASGQAHLLRVYRTHPNGELLYQAAEAMAGLPSLILGNDSLGPAAATMHLRQMPPGEHIAMFKGYLLVAHGNVLRFSEPMRYGLWSPRHSFVQLPHRITMLAALDGAVFVGTTAGVTVLTGDRPKQWRPRVTAALPPIPRSGAMIASANMRSEAGGQDAVIWLTEKGFVMGTEGGGIVELQASQIKGIAAQQAAVCVHGRRVVAALT